jgi:digalactosyldiacylglycerol synthase
MVDGDLPTKQSDMRPSSYTSVRTFHVVTTAALPWQTGTAVNPLLRAAHLSRLNRPYTNNKSTVTLVVPWLESSDDRVYLYGEEWRDKTKKDQDEYIREWLVYKAELALEANLSTGGIQIQFYNARWHKGMNSIFAMGDIESCIPDDEAGEY